MWLEARAIRKTTELTTPINFENVITENKNKIKGKTQ